MSVKLQIILFLIWFLIFFALLRILKSKRADIKYILPWLGLDLILVFFTAFPRVLVWLANLFGIVIPSNMLFFFGMIFLTIISFSMSLTISKQNDQIRILSQKIALNEFMKPQETSEKMSE